VPVDISATTNTNTQASERVIQVVLLIELGGKALVKKSVVVLFLPQERVKIKECMHMANQTEVIG